MSEPKMPGRVCETCGDTLLYHERYKALWCPGCATPATMKERYQAAKQMAEYHKEKCATLTTDIQTLRAALAEAERERDEEHAAEVATEGARIRLEYDYTALTARVAELEGALRDIARDERYTGDTTENQVNRMKRKARERLAAPPPERGT